mgnify:FL=1
MSAEPKTKGNRVVLPFLTGFVTGDFVHAYIMDLQDSGDFFDLEGLMILLIAGPFTSPVICLSIMFACGLVAASLPLLWKRTK